LGLKEVSQAELLRREEGIHMGLEELGLGGKRREKPPQHPSDQGDGPSKDKPPRKRKITK